MTYRPTIVEWCQDRVSGWKTPHTQRFLTTSLGSTALLEAGAGTDTIVYLPGTNFNAATSLGLLSAVVDAGLRVVCADLPGQPGMSAAERPKDEATAYRTWVCEVLEEVRGGTLVGHSRGAAVALSADPGLVDRLVLLSPAGLVPVRPTWPMMRATIPWLVRRNDAGSRRMLDLMAGPTHDYPDDLVPWMTMLARLTRTTGAPGRGPEDWLRAWRHSDVRVLVGARDCFFPPSAIRNEVRTDLDAELMVLPEIGHLLIDQAPHAVVAQCL